MGLAERWENWLGCFHVEEPQKDLWPQIEEMYSNPLRRYHTVPHIEDVVVRLDELKQSHFVPVSWEVLYTAAALHDVIYDARSKRNEADSAAFAYGLTGSSAVATIIKATTHRFPPNTKDEAALLDADLSGLGYDWDTFWQASLDIRHEFKFVMLADFVAGRTAFFQTMLKRPTIFYTGFFKERYEAQARENMQTGIDWMRMGRMVDEP